MEHTHISGLEGLITVLYVIAIMGALNLAAKKWKDQNKILAAYAYLFNIAQYHSTKEDSSPSGTQGENK